MDAFTDLNLKKAGYETTPIDTHSLDAYQIVKANITSQTVEALKDFDLDSKSKARCKNFYALGMTYFMFHRDLDATINWIGQKFGKKPVLVRSKRCCS